MTEHKKIAIACQGGGSHTAFTAGALSTIALDDDIDIVALSGTSGGAICATLLWYAMVTGEKDKAPDLLYSFWNDNAANTLWDLIVNFMIVEASRISDTVTMPVASPYNYPQWARDTLKGLIEKYIDFDRIQAISPPLPLLFVGAVEVLSGSFEVFTKDTINVHGLLASAAVPPLFRAVPTQEGIYWDGLFSQNPPIRNLPDARPDEIWIIQINPAQAKEEPKSIQKIQDRRNELSGNLSLFQEVYYIETMNKLIRQGLLSCPKYKIIDIHTIEMPDTLELDYSSKLDRRPSFIQELMILGKEEAESFLKKRSKP